MIPVLRFERSVPEKDLRLAIVMCGRICYDRGLLTSNDGNLSTRLGAGRLLITPSGICKGRMSPDDLLLIDLHGNIIEGAGGRPSTETAMHLEVYRNRADVCAVIHAHPVFATALTVAGVEFPDDILPEIVLLLGGVPVTKYATPSSEENADAIRPLIGQHNAILLKQHGALTCGSDLEQALLHLERLEHVAEVYWRARALGHVERLTPDALERLHTMRDGLSGK